MNNYKFPPHSIYHILLSNLICIIFIISLWFIFVHPAHASQFHSIWGRTSRFFLFFFRCKSWHRKITRLSTLKWQENNKSTLASRKKSKQRGNEQNPRSLLERRKGKNNCWKCFMGRHAKFQKTDNEWKWYSTDICNLIKITKKLWREGALVSECPRGIKSWKAKVWE